jgi:transposase
LAKEIAKRGERCNLQTFFRLVGARYKRIRKRPRETPSPQLVELKRYQLQELENLWRTGNINLYFGDESHVCTSGYVPYGWQFEDEDVFVPSKNRERLNIFGMVSPNCQYKGFDTTDSITGGMLAEWLDDFSKTIVKPTFVVLDNASIHRKGEVAKRITEWKERGLYIFYLPTYSPHLNIAETVWRFLKGMWLKPHHYCSRSILHETTREILDSIGIEYVINFSHAA